MTTPSPSETHDLHVTVNEHGRELASMRSDMAGIRREIHGILQQFKEFTVTSKQTFESLRDELVRSRTEITDRARVPWGEIMKAMSMMGGVITVFLTVIFGLVNYAYTRDVTNQAESLKSLTATVQTHISDSGHPGRVIEMIETDRKQRIVDRADLTERLDRMEKRLQREIALRERANKLRVAELERRVLHAERIDEEYARRIYGTSDGTNSRLKLLEGWATSSIPAPVRRPAR